MMSLTARIAEITTLRDRDALCQAMVACLAKYTGAMATTYLVAETDAEDYWRAVCRFPSEDLLRDHSGWAATEPLACSELAAERREAVDSGTTRTHTGRSGLVSVVPFPIDDQREGVVEIESLEPLSSDQLSDVSDVLVICRNMLRLLHRGERDALTKLLNRKNFDKTYHALLSRTTRREAFGSSDRRKTHGLWLAMLDADHFKRVNDTYGHLTGDEVLVQLAKIMTSVFGGDEHVYRFGGEEFVALIPADSRIKVMSRVETIRARAAANEYANGLRVTVSIGVTAVMAGEAPNTAIGRADHAVYQAKKLGRNRVCFDDALPEFVGSESPARLLFNA